MLCAASSTSVQKANAPGAGNTTTRSDRTQHVRGVEMAKAIRICSVPECGKPHIARGLCPAHYWKWRKHGDPLSPDRRLRVKGQCSVDGCEKTSETGDKCGAHYRRQLAHGDPLAGGTGQGETKRWVKEVALSFTGDACLTWPFSRQKNGYGKLWSGERLVLAHRFVCELTHGAPPSATTEAAHSCGNGRLGCVNPKHVRWATHVENEAEKVGHGTRLRGERIGNSKLTADDVRHIRSSGLSQKMAAEAYGVSRSNIGMIRAGKTWGWLA